MNSMLSEIFFDASYLFIVIGSFIALFFGLALLLAPIATLKFNAKINTHISLREKTKNIEKQIKSETYFYKYSKISGALLIFGSLFLLYTLSTFNIYNLIPYLSHQLSSSAWEWLLQSAQLFFYITGSFILLFGLLIFIRPSTIKKFEEASNHWVSTRKHFSKMSKDIHFANKLVNAYPRAFGGVGIILIMLELFIIPGFGIAGISGIILTFSGLLLSLINNVQFDFSMTGSGDVSQALIILISSILLSSLGI